MTALKKGIPGLGGVVIAALFVLAPTLAVAIPVLPPIGGTLRAGSNLGVSPGSVSDSGGFSDPTFGAWAWSASARTEGGGVPSVLLVSSGNATLPGQFGIYPGGFISTSAILTYGFVVTAAPGNPPPPGTMSIPIVVATLGDLSLTGNSATLSTAEVSLSLSSYGRLTRRFLPTFGGLRTLSFDEEYHVSVDQDVVQLITMSGGGTLHVGAGLVADAGDLRAFMDPVITIDPTWQYASNFIITFSEGIGAGPGPGPAPGVPEPAAALLFGLGLVGLLTAHRSRRRA